MHFQNMKTVQKINDNNPKWVVEAKHLEPPIQQWRMALISHCNSIFLFLVHL